MLKIITKQILQKLNIPSSSIAITKYNISFDTLIYTLIDQGSVERTAEVLGITKDSLKYYIRRPLKTILPEKSPKENWRLVLLKVVGLIECTSCQGFLGIEEFSDKFLVKHNYVCRSCNNKKASVYREDNPDICRDYQKEYYLSHKKEAIERSVKRRLAKLNRTPIWVDRTKLIEIYKNCPEGYHVDHIIPLQGELVSGLHVPENLQYLTPEENLKKHNTFYIE